MTGYHIYCRVWVGFSPTFPYFDELNPLPDEELVRKLNDRARQWLRENRPTAKQRYRDEAVALDALAKEIRKWQRSSTPRGIPNMSSYDKSVIIQNLRLCKRSKLLEEAERHGVQLALSDQDLRAAILDAMEMEHLQHEFEKRRGEHQLYSQDVRDRFDVKTRVRGDKQATSLETRIAKIAGWTSEVIHRFGHFSPPPVKVLTCGVSPTPRLMLRWFATGEKVDEFVKVANSRFQRHDWNHIVIKFGVFSCANLGASELTMIDQQQREKLDPDSKWTGTPLYRAIKNEFDRTIKDFEAVLSRENNASGPSSSVAAGAAQSVDEIINSFRKEWFTIYELAQISGLSEDAIEGRIRRWADKTETPESAYKHELPETSSGAARYMYRVGLIWPLMSKKPEISEKNSG